MTLKVKLSKKQLASLKAFESCQTQEPADPRVEGLVTELIDRIAGKWTMLILEVLIERGELRRRKGLGSHLRSARTGAPLWQSRYPGEALR